MSSRTGGELLLDSLLALGADVAFGVPGESYLAVLDAMHDRADRFDFTVARNEGGACFMAEAHGKLTGRPGLCFVTRGPGATNASIGVHTAFQNSTPMILFIGQVGTDMMGREAFQEIDYTQFYGSVAKWVVSIDQVSRIPEILSRAWSTALSGRPGPVVVALPEDMLTTLTSVELALPVRIAQPAPTRDSIDEVIERLEKASRPLMLVGGGGWSESATEGFQAFAESHDIPVAAAFRFQDVFDNTSPCYAGDAGVGMTAAMQALIRQSDLILAIGIRLGEMTTHGYTLLEVPEPKQSLIHVHPSAAELSKVYNPALPIVASADQFASALAQRSLNVRFERWCKRARQNYLDELSVPVQPGAVDMSFVIKVVQSHLSVDAIITNGAGNFAVWPNRYLSYGRDQRLLAPQSGAMGYGLPAAIAAKRNHPDRQVICFAGDGDFQMNCQELGTAMQTGACPVVLVLNNGSYGTIRMHQERHYPERITGTDLVNPDFVALAKAYGFHSELIVDTSQFEAAFVRALASQSGAVLELRTSIEALSPRVTLAEVRHQL